jgi:hypothetical protein
MLHLRWGEFPTGNEAPVWMRDHNKPGVLIDVVDGRLSMIAAIDHLRRGIGDMSLYCFTKLGSVF